MLLLLCLFLGADMPKKIMNTTLALDAAPSPAADDKWKVKVKYEQIDKRDGKVAYKVDEVDAYQVPSGKWVVRHKDIRVTMHQRDRIYEDRITTPAGDVLVIEKFDGGAERLLYTRPLAPPPKK